jgi:crotonobetainyl-CoA:carnitine CoA-transferase CaiB-like acyl-CoA transferase
MGARVIKVERQDGDFARGYDGAAKGLSSYFAWTNRGKESLVLDIKDAVDRDLLRTIALQADVLVQNLAPGALSRAGLGSDHLRSLNHRLITCDITGYGDSDEVAHLKAYDLLVQCESGLAGITGVPEGCGRVGVSICDIGAGLNATIAILSALALRARTGSGSGVSVSLFDGAADWMTVPYLHERYGKGAPQRLGLNHPSIAPYGAFRTSDEREIVISIQNEREWRLFCEHCLGDASIANDTRFSNNNARVAHREQLNALIGRWFATLLLSEAISLLADANIAFGQVRSVTDFATHPALRTWPMPGPGGLLTMVAPPVRAPWDRGSFEPAPRLGEHSGDIRKEFSTAAATA